MRFRTSTVILSLALATTAVLAFPAPDAPLASASSTSSPSSILAASPRHLTHLQKRNWVTDKLKALLQEALTSLECTACEAALVGVKDVAYLNKNWVLSALNELCPSLAKEPADVCTGLINSQGPVILDSLLKADLTGGDGKEICFQVLGVCPAPAVSSGQLTFPKPRPANPVTPHASGTLTDDLLKYVPTIAKPAFAILTGDIPPHDVWAETKDTVVGEEANAYGVLAALGATVYPTIGNHE
ncbi:hypothetical protein BGZ96_006906, partial [Linnemannia gamsii]